MSDEEIMRIVINGCDALDITRVHEKLRLGWETTTIFSNDGALLRVVRAVLEEAECH